MAKLLEELKRRKVVRVAGVYAVVAWVLIQVANNLVPALQLPAWTNSFIVLLLLIGFPIALVLAWAYEITPEGIKSDTAVQASAQIPAPQSQRLIYATFILVLLVAGIQIADRFLFAPSTGPVVSGEATGGGGAAASISTLSRRAYINIGITTPLSGPGINADIALSADGSKLVYIVDRPGPAGPRLYLRYLDQLEEQELFEGDVRNPFFSPDGGWAGFRTAGDMRLNKISIRGGSPQLVSVPTRDGTGSFWSVDDTIFYTSAERRLMRGSASGGVPETLDIVFDGATQSWPYLLPGADALLYTTGVDTGDVGDGRIDLLIQSTGEVRSIIQNAYNARYAPTGHIVFVRAAALWAVPFDVDRLETTGPERPVIQGVQSDSERGPTVYAFSDDGLLVYLPGGDTKASGIETSLIWVDREGNEEVLPQLRNFARADVSPDGRRLAVGITDSGNADIWTYDLTRNTLSRLTFDESFESRPLWTPDGERIVFGSTREGGGLWWRKADGTGLAEPLLTGSPDAFPYAFTPDGTQLLYTFNGDIYTLTPVSEVPSQPLIQSEFNESRPALSPDGRWLAYESNETGRYEIYVRPFPDIEDGKWQVSNEGGRSAKWAPDGRELFFQGPSTGVGSTVWMAQVETGALFQSETPAMLVEGDYREQSLGGTFDISADGSRFLLQRQTRNSIQDTEVTLLVTVENWFEELKRLAPPDPQ